MLEKTNCIDDERVAAFVTADRFSVPGRFDIGRMRHIQVDMAHLRPGRHDHHDLVRQLIDEERRADDIVIEVRGLARSILKAERVALNFLQRLCGIATLTRQFVDAVGEHPAKILDTRKTTPGLRALEKAAVVAGGGVNHRSGLFDMVLVKDNHLAALGGLAGFADEIRRLRQERPDVRIEVEADDLEQARAFVEIDGIDVILLDNMEPAQIREALALRRNNIKFEASGGITLKNVRRIAATGVDYISIGALTNSARAVDLGLEMTHVHG